MTIAQQLIQEGRLEGKKIGFEEGREEGREVGREVGRLEGMVEEKINIAKRLLAANAPSSLIEDVTGLSLDEIVV